MTIVQAGEIELSIVMDNEQKIVLEKLTRGSIIGAYTFLVADENEVLATISTGTHIFTIERKRFT